MSAGSCLVLLSLGHFASILRDSGLIEWLPHHLEQLGGPGSCKTPAATPMTSWGYLYRGSSARLLLLLATAALEADTPPLCLDPLGSHILGAVLSPYEGLFLERGSPPPHLLLRGETHPSQGWTRWEGKFSGKLSSSSELLPALLSLSSLPLCKDKTFETQKPRTDSGFLLLPGASFLLGGSGTKCLVPTLGEGS